MAAEPQLSPMMAQYRRIKADLPKDALLLFRLGDFYEMFFEDAQIGAQLLNLTLTQRNQIPMCGLPYHAAGNYLSRLLRAGRKVAICDQTEEARPGKLVQREVTSILSPGTHFDDRLLRAEQNNFLAAVFSCGKSHGLAVVDLTTGDFRLTELASPTAALAEVDRLRPAELIYPSNQPEWVELLRECRVQINAYEDWTFLPETAVYTLREHFKVASLDGFGLKDRHAAVGAGGAVLHYITQHLRRNPANLTRLSVYESSDYLILDTTTLRNLEILEPLHSDGSRQSTLFFAVNKTMTPMGSRQLRDWLTQPLSTVQAILDRQSCVEAFLQNQVLLDAFRGALRDVRDLERTLSRLSMGSGNARDLNALRLALAQVPELKRVLAEIQQLPVQSPQLHLADTETHDVEGPRLLSLLQEQLEALPDLVHRLSQAITEDPPLALKEGGMFRDGFHPDLDALRTAARSGRDWIAQLQQDEVARTGIPSLKIGFNSVFGYFLEVTKANLSKVPEEYIRKQTIANGERFITPALKEMEQKILGADERATKLEYDLFQSLRGEVLEFVPTIQHTARAVASLDVLAAFAECARLFDWTRPVIQDEGVLSLKDSRHPVLERSLVDERFVPNDAELNLDRQQIALITGPNMAGKSTFIRQIALLTLLAHTGSFIPATHARIDRVDRIFTRIGASDNLARGQSTFMVEMSETANILNNATRSSLVILDEIGRGTSTFDGLSLAWSIVEHLHHQLGAKTLFATHYHELTELADRLPRVGNFHVVVREWNDQIVFLHKVEPGGTDKSYGIQVARLAGVPREVIDRAKIILNILEESELNLKQVMNPVETNPDTVQSDPQPERKRKPKQDENSDSAETIPDSTTQSKAAQRKDRDREKLRNLTASPQLDLFARDTDSA